MTQDIRVRIDGREVEVEVGIVDNTGDLDTWNGAVCADWTVEPLEATWANGQPVDEATWARIDSDEMTATLEDAAADAMAQWGEP